MSAPGPPGLGRGVVMAKGAEVPPPWRACDRYCIDDDVLAEPLPLVEKLHEAWLGRRPAVVELAVDPAELRAPEVIALEPHECDPGMELARERLQFLTWTNSYDARRAGEPIWWHARRAVRLGAQEGGPADVVLADGTLAWCDGGPCEPLDVGAAVMHRWSLEAGSLTPSGWLGGSVAGRGAVAGLGTAARTAGPQHEGLAPDQLAAVTHRRGPARVIAPAGSGKTRVLTARLRHLLAERGVHPSTVTAVAFNRRAVDELAERTADLAAQGYRPHIRTVNSLALAICNGLGGGAPRRRLRVIEEREARRILESITHVRPQANTDILAPYLEALSMIRIGLVGPDRAEEAISDAQGLPGVFAQYRRVLAQESMADFDEQIYQAIQILLADPQARQGAQALARHLLVDECQDLAPAHLLLLRLVGMPTLDCFGVGDDDQCIYGYAGADPDYLISFERYWPGATAYELEIGYRCPPGVIGGVTRLLSHNRRRIPKASRPVPGRAPEAQDLVVRSAAPERMGPEVVAQVAAWAAGGVGLGEIAVLARVNAALLGAQVALSAGGVACTRPLDARVLERTGMRSALAYLRIAVNPARIARADIAETIRRPPRRIARNAIEMLTKPPWSGVAQIRRLAKRLSGEDSSKLASYADQLDALSRAVGSGTAAVLRAIRLRVGLGEAMSALDGSRGAVERSAHADDLAALEQVAASHREAATFEHWLRGMLEPGELDGAAGGAVQLSSVHRVKGLEWSRVVVLGASASLFPHTLAHDVEEERRIFHVALTRGRDQVVVLVDSEAPSPFVGELTTSAPEGNAQVQAPSQARGPDRPAKGSRGGGKAAPPGPPNPGEALLRSWRTDQARADGVPAYIILTDDQLVGIAAARPTTLGALARCRGMGPIRLERYGDAILAVLEQVRAPNG